MIYGVACYLSYPALQHQVDVCGQLEDALQRGDAVQTRGGSVQVQVGEHPGQIVRVRLRQFLTQ